MGGSENHGWVMKMMVLVLLAAVPQKNLHESSVRHCQTTTVSGGHTARAEWEARQGALADATDVCPAGKVSPLQMSCTPVDGAQGINGYDAMKCVQQAACTLCGADLARMQELNQ